jgi:hypothetical protein
MLGSLRDEFDVIIVPDIREEELLEGETSDEKLPPEYHHGIGLLGVQALENFALEGGTLIAFVSPSRTFIKYFELPVGDILRGIENTDFNIPGSLIRLKVHTEHPLAFGMQSEAVAMFRRGLAFSIPEDNDLVESVVDYASDDLLVSGYAHGEEKIADASAMAVVKHGQGSVVLFGFPPQFRAQTWVTFKLIFNAILNSAKPFDLEGIDPEPDGPHVTIEIPGNSR